MLLFLLLCANLSFARPRPPMPPLPEMAPALWQEHFDQRFPYDIEDPSTLTIEDFGELVESWSGYGLGRSGVLLPAYTLPGLDAQGRALINPGSGAMRLWISPSWSSSSIKKGTGPGDLGCLLELSATDGRSVPVVCWSLVINPDGTRISLVADSDSGVVELLGAPIQWTVGQAHFVALNFGTNATALYLDGQLAVQGSGTIALPASVARLTFGSASTGTEAVQAVIDELYSFRRPLTAADVAFYYNGNASQAALGPITVEEDLARAARVLAFKSRPLGTVQPDAMLLETLEESGASAYEEGTLWIEITGATSNEVSVVVHGTQVDMVYELLSKTNLADTIWVSEGQPFLGQDGQTATTVTPGERTNSLFLRARSWVDSDGSGMPDWWQLQWFGQTGVDPYGDDDQDGWTNLQEYQNGTNPKALDLLPPPQGVRARVDATGTNVIISWESGGGPVVQYVVEDPYYGLVGVTNQSGRSVVATPEHPLTGNHFIKPKYRVWAVSSNGSSNACSLVSPFLPELTPDARLVRGPGGQFYLALSSLPDGIDKILCSNEEGDCSFEIAASNVANGIAPIPFERIQEHSGGFAVEVLSTTGRFGDSRFVSPYVDFTANCPSDSRFHPGFVNASRHMKENLAFLLRAGRVTLPFSYASNLGVNGSYVCLADPSFADSPEGAYARNASPPTYECYGYRFYSPNLGHSFLDELRPVQENHLWLNFLFDSSLFENGAFDTGAWYYHPAYMRMLEYPLYTFNGSGTPLVLSNSTEQAFYACHTGTDAPTFCPELLAEAGVSTNGNGGFGIFNTNVRNVYGLPVRQILIGSNLTVWPGNTATNGDYFLSVDMPDLGTVGYYFTKYPSDCGTLSPIPGFPDFSVTQTSRMMVAGVGEPITVSGWAKQAITNGYPDKFAYLEQYFEKAYKIAADGTVTTNETGILSPYGEFLPTEPGPTAIVTMPDIDTNERGTGVVHAVKLQLDVNHDGIMDLSFAGPDNTTWDRPFVFWVNNDCDRTGVGSDSVVYPNSTILDWQQGYVRSQRNLEDFARLRVCGLPKLPADQGYRATLSMSASSGTPTINLYPAFTNSADYLSSTNAAAAQFMQYYFNGQLVFDYSKKLSTVSPSQSYNLPISADGIPLYTNFLFEGAGTNGSGQLTLTISQTTAQGSNVLVQTSMWLDLHDVKDFYERAVITNNTSGAKSNWTSGIEIVQPGTAQSLGDDTNLIVLVHGINVPYPDWGIEGDTVLKRLYWAGFRGKFAAVKWPCELFSAWTGLTLDTSVFNRSEMKAYKAGSALKAYLSQLRDRFPSYRIHLLVHSQGNSVASEAIEAGATFDTYILTQGALPDSAYDVNAPIDSGLASQEVTNCPTPLSQPMGYRGAYTNMTGKIVNFYNTNDPVLKVWMLDQGAAKPDGYLMHWLETIPPISYYSSDGTNGWYNASLVIGSYTVTDPQESRAYVSRSRTAPIGQSPPETQHGVIKSGVDLNGRYGFNNAFPDDHSAQWAWPIQRTLPYFKKVLTSCGIQPAP